MAQGTQTDAAARFAPLRPRLTRIAYRMLGSVADAEDVVQDAFLRWMGADHDAGNLCRPLAPRTAGGGRG